MQSKYGQNIGRQEFVGQPPHQFRPSGGTFRNASAKSLNAEDGFRKNTLAVSTALVSQTHVAAVCVLNGQNIVVGLFPSALWARLLPEGWTFGRDQLPAEWHAAVWADLHAVAVDLSARMAVLVLGLPDEALAEVKAKLEAGIVGEGEQDGR